MDFFPLFLDLKGQSVLLVGGMDSARGKLELLHKAGAKILWLSPKLSPELEPLALLPGVTHSLDPFEPDHLLGMKLVLVCADDLELAARISRLAQDRGLPVNVVDRPQWCSFIMPSIIDRSPLVMAVSSSGNCPRLSRLVRAKLETLFPQSYSRLALMMGAFRESSKDQFLDPEARRRFWDRIFASPIIEMFLSGQEQMAQKALEQELVTQQSAPPRYGQVALVGAGPGDPDLLTLRALRLIQTADVVVYDRLVSPVVLEYARREAQRIYVGKKSSEHTVPQDQINQTLINLAKEGKQVVRLKGGDPFIFGRGGEEIELLVEAGIDFLVVPGVTAASGCGTYAGIPLTHRDFAQSVCFITGHLREDGTLEMQWQHLVQKNQTLVFYMGLASLPQISDQLIAHGMDPKTPVALIERGTTYNQRVYTSTLDRSPELAQKEAITPPTLIIIGAVVGLREKLKWFDPAQFDEPARPPFLQP
ncbi:MAG: uroporphyrinogen-III C-methyltransferase [Candidatus Lambdaproteobacteria bacterium RIFOXYD1_FULL_56_27]|uniref:Siroheme synthase n=1 Tax=Candidatus Lambdaproteobacteria bacterium RIFOXYD2_FULL_56_26 TaxID=1817773 RepID=A0A1F6GTR8_9PROT|nr:MAG: uroporphyrinogen-III C-methyltransferase [Candidatus Lambdaproteobacteria bacterium RIFOXYC1_FULL_56_13]OGH01537.1 MAG: uroporphyrinogen-III C-methyltransferase [Candidatus Lambdaproteobacteria bacterium RIFOXYD2_FULL_56_26]OGH06758.1 MAG: uroporphyrinogen-III C-methyltransferase [Candidatus Lambdaproteobacteria bacterium RIFOXYD1_FULL_56_27]